MGDWRPEVTAIVTVRLEKRRTKLVSATMSKVWELIKIGEYEKACRVTDEEFNKSSSILPLRNKVFALLRRQRYRDAALLCDKIIRLRNGDTDSDFIFLGTSCWLDGRQDEAIAAWQSSSDAKYTDAAGGVEICLLLLYASIKRSDNSLRQECESTLEASCRQPAIRNWPGPIARFVLRKLSEDALLSATSGQPTLKAKQLCQAEFYIGVMRLADGDLERCLTHMMRSTSLGEACLLKQEFYLADAEVRGSS
jgi:hypothetical protein